MIFYSFQILFDLASFNIPYALQLGKSLTFEGVLSLGYRDNGHGCKWDDADAEKGRQKFGFQLEFDGH